MNEPHEIRLKRLRMRSWRRGIKEMDLILGSFADSYLVDLAPKMLDAYEALLEENDQDLYPWYTKRIKTPANHREILDKIRAAEKF